MKNEKQFVNHPSTNRPLSEQQLAIHSKAIQYAQEFKKAENNLLETLERVSKQKIYLYRGYSSLFVYAVECLKLSEKTNLLTIKFTIHP